jgi:hypothetical protein
MGKCVRFCASTREVHGGEKEETPSSVSAVTIVDNVILPENLGQRTTDIFIEYSSSHSIHSLKLMMRVTSSPSA